MSSKNSRWNVVRKNTCSNAIAYLTNLEGFYLGLRGMGSIKNTNASEGFEPVLQWTSNYFY